MLLTGTHDTEGIEVQKAEKPPLKTLPATIPSPSIYLPTYSDTVAKYSQGFTEELNWEKKLSMTEGGKTIRWLLLVRQWGEVKKTSLAMEPSGRLVCWNPVHSVLYAYRRHEVKKM